MPGPLFPIVGPLVAALVAFGVARRSPRLAGVFGALAVLLLAVLMAPLGSGFVRSEEVLILGRSLQLTDPVRDALLISYLAAALIFGLSTAWFPGKDFVALGLAALAPLAVTLMVDPFAFGMVTLLVGACLLAVMIQGGRTGSTLASLRFLIIVTLAVPCFLIAGWMLESQPETFASTIWQLLLGGTALLLAGFPFQVWVRPLLSESHPFAALYVLTLFQWIAVVFVLQLLGEYALLQTEMFTTILAASGSGSALVAALLAFHSQGPRRLLGYVLIADMGAVLVGVSFGANEVTYLLLILRFVGFLLATVGLIVLEARVSGRERRLGTILYAYGVVSLIGLPLTAGFSGRWALLGTASVASPWWALPFLLAMLSATVGLVRLLRNLPQPEAPGVAPAHARRERALAIVLGAGFLVGLLPGLVPALTLRLVGG